jgi:hypothetical protein
VTLLFLIPNTRVLSFRTGGVSPEESAVLESGNGARAELLRIHHGEQEPRGGKKKVRLIEDRNPTWGDLAEGWGEAAVMRVSRKADSEPGLRPVRNDIGS